MPLHRSLSTEQLLRTGAFKHGRFGTEKPLPREAFTQNSFYRHQLLLTEVFTHGNFTLRCLDTEQLLRREASTHTEKPLHHMQNRNLHQFLVYFVRKGCDWLCKVTLLHQFLTFGLPSRGKRLRLTLQNSTFTTVFYVWPLTLQNHNSKPISQHVPLAL